MEEEEATSWVTRAKFSHVIVRSNSSREHSAPFDRSSERKTRAGLSSILPSAQQSDHNVGWKQTSASVKILSPRPDVDLGLKLRSSKLELNTSRSPDLTPRSTVSAMPQNQSKSYERRSRPKTKRLTSSSTAVTNNAESDSNSRVGIEADEGTCEESFDFSFYPQGVPGLISNDSGLSYVSSPFMCAESDPVKTSKSIPKQRSLSPLPTTVISDVFKEAKTIRKRFTTPPPSRKGLDKSPFGKMLCRGAPESHSFNSTLPPEMGGSCPNLPSKASQKSKQRKDSSWARYFDHGGGRVTAVETTKEWMVDLSQLYLGLRFAAGAHSRLYHGIYKDQPVAVKIIRQPDVYENGVMAARLEKHFTREVTLLSHLYHRNVIKLAGACKKPPVFFVITEYLAGGSLRAFLHKLDHKPLPLDKQIVIALDIARGMEYIHSQGVVHRDLKPENILFDEECCVKIADFGIACEESCCDPVADDPGTYRWMAPEMIKYKPYGRKVDVYSFGLLLWEMVTGTIPYEDMTPMQAAFAVVNKNLRPVIPADCPAVLGALIAQCWALLPEKRPEFWQIVKVMEQFEYALARDGSIDQLQDLTCQDRKKRISHRI